MKSYIKLSKSLKRNSKNLMEGLKNKERTGKTTDKKTVNKEKK